MNPWEVLWIALGWMAVIAIMLIVSLIVLTIAISTIGALRKELRKRQ